VCCPRSAWLRIGKRSLEHTERPGTPRGERAVVVMGWEGSHLGRVAEHRIRLDSGQCQELMDEKRPCEVADNPK
jgi:hypothetical protein